MSPLELCGETPKMTSDIFKEAEERALQKATEPRQFVILPCKANIEPGDVLARGDNSVIWKAMRHNRACDHSLPRVRVSGNVVPGWPGRVVFADSDKFDEAMEYGESPPLYHPNLVYIKGADFAHKQWFPYTPCRVRAINPEDEDDRL